ncbi:MAG: M1 family metallopeptidase [Bacteroidia bacterium]|nr:M1 family metallopeptidase [Bacteroidia bacterium]
MIKNIYIIFLLLLWVFPCCSQEFGSLLTPGEYRRKDNPYYWKNRKPYEGYWQQDVYYKINAVLDDKTDIIHGKEELTYWNNSPHAIGYVYFHLYQNAFQPGSYFDNVSLNSSRPLKFGRYGIQKKGTEVISTKVDGNELHVELDNTILKVYLPRPLQSNDSITFLIEFRTYFEEDCGWRRMSLFSVDNVKHYNIVLWYPRIAMFDRHFGWATDQDLGKEYNGDYGAYNVWLTLPNNYICDGTGLLVNREEVLPADLREKLDINNFRNKPWGEPSSVIIPYDSAATKTWKFQAENVHDFAATADPTYRIGEINYKGLQVVALAQESHAAGWQNAALTALQIIMFYEKATGEYHYPKIIVADAGQGMEYPMVTLDSEFDPYYKYVFSHEIAHQWFYGMVGSNETYSAVLDEGFTQYLTVFALQKFIAEGEPLNFPESSKYISRFTKNYDPYYKYSLFPYLEKALNKRERPLNTHSDAFDDWYQYRLVYYKGATMLFNLQYVLGDSMFFKALQYYFDKWKFCHPYLQDFRDAIIEYTGADLNWFFDQWLETTKTIDYSVKSVKKINKNVNYEIRFHRKGEMQMPIDFTVISKQGMRYNYNIPNTWFQKSTKDTIMPKWFGWGKLYPDYKAYVNIPGGIKDVVIDTTCRLADINLLNNSKKFPYTLKLDGMLDNLPDNRNYEIKYRPDFWYNGYDGVKAGIHFNGDYLAYYHKIRFTLWYNTGLLSNKFILPEIAHKHAPFSFELNYRTLFIKRSNDKTLDIALKYLDGLQYLKLGIEKDISENHNLLFYFKSLYRYGYLDNVYLLYPDEWETGKFNNSINIRYGYEYYLKKGGGLIILQMKAPVMSDFYNYSYINSTILNRYNLWKLTLKSRLFGQYGITGCRGIPIESNLYLSGANPEEMFENKFTRSIGFFDNNFKCARLCRLYST